MSKPESKAALVDTIQLIKLVYNRPALWDRNSREYREKHTREQCWIDLYREMDPLYDNLKPLKKEQFGHQITKKWYNIRDSYVKSKRHGAYKRSRPYLYSDVLTFLDPIYFQDDGQNPEDRPASNDGDNDQDNESEHYLSEMFLDTEEDPTPKKSKLDLVDSMKPKEEESIVSVLVNLIQKEEDEDRAFFKSITPSVKALSDESKLEFRIQVMNLIRHLKVKEQNVKSEKLSNHSESE